MSRYPFNDGHTSKFLLAMRVISYYRAIRFFLYFSASTPFHLCIFLFLLLLRVCVCARACMRACMRECVRACVRVGMRVADLGRCGRLSKSGSYSVFTQHFL